jgi:hypothetical protein
MSLSLRMFEGCSFRSSSRTWQQTAAGKRGDCVMFATHYTATASNLACRLKLVEYI